ncbi:protein of unknown function [Pseudomonas sp. JV551A1]|uniref:Uncharacterized protein n=1 Tax=Pseudomonas inefficax TaxID=2078786 RepID=A0AAQ1P6S6_9PSED|nr:protein of unknown function [Pseudomonas sp. JV551A1]SPO60832.1 protein of unknown function [Pseudomonas inefficax]
MTILGKAGSGRQIVPQAPSSRQLGLSFRHLQKSPTRRSDASYLLPLPTINMIGTG